jgi:tRNA-binding EMAP/Myf-like protein
MFTLRHPNSGSSMRLPGRVALRRLAPVYTPEQPAGRLVVAVTNFPPRQIASFMSEVLVLGVPEAGTGDIILLTPDADVPPGTRVF